MKQNKTKHNYASILKSFAANLDKINEGIVEYNKTNKILYKKYKDYSLNAIDYTRATNKVLEKPIECFDFYREIIEGNSTNYDFNLSKLPNELAQLIRFLKEANKQLNKIYDLSELNNYSDICECLDTSGIDSAEDYVLTWLYQNNHLDVDNDEIYIRTQKH